MTDKLIDILDIASQNEQLATKKAIQQASIKAGKLEVEATGKCLNCDEELTEGKRFCNAGCRDDWQRMQR